MHPEWNIDQTVAVLSNETLNLDAQPTTRSIRAKADTPDEINQMFDGIAYGKAGAVLGTVENYLGEETFRRGVHNYLSAHLYANATAEDFWNAQTAASHKPVDQIMDSLVAQPGEPVLTFGVPANGKVAVEQNRFFLSPALQADPAQKWTLPVCFKTALGQDCQLLTPAETALNIPAQGAFANARDKGYYRSAYAPSAYASLVAQVETTLTPVERIGLVGDEWAQVRANKVPVGQYLDLVAAVKGDTNAEVISNATTASPASERKGAEGGGVKSVYAQIAASAEEKAALAAWIRTTFAPEFAKLGSPAASDSDNVRELRAALFAILGEEGADSAVVARANQIAQQYLANPASVDITLGQIALTIAARNGDSALFDKLQNLYETSSNPETQEGALHLLAEFKDPALEQRALDYAVHSKVRNQDAAGQLAISLQDSERSAPAWSYIQNHWDNVQALLTTAMGGILVKSTGSFCSPAERDSVKSFFAAHPVPASELALKHALEQIDGCIELRKLQEPNLKRWLAAQPKP